MLSDRCQGPFTLDELAAAGVRPDTYVWCKEMSDWQRADEVADICRYFRQRIVALQHPEPRLPDVTAQQPVDNTPEEDPYEAVPPSFRYMVRRSGEAPPDPKAIEDPAEHDPATPPPSGMLVTAILAMLFCFPITGAVAVYFAVKARNTWAEASRSHSKTSRELYSDMERTELRNAMADAVRHCKMWTGITVFLGLVIYAAFIHLI